MARVDNQEEVQVIKPKHRLDGDDEEFTGIEHLRKRGSAWVKMLDIADHSTDILGKVEANMNQLSLLSILVAAFALTGFLMFPEVDTEGDTWRTIVGISSSASTLSSVGAAVGALIISAWLPVLPKADELPPKLAAFMTVSYFDSFGSYLLLPLVLVMVSIAFFMTMVCALSWFHGKTTFYFTCGFAGVISLLLLFYFMVFTKRTKMILDRMQQRQEKLE